MPQYLGKELCALSSTPMIKNYNTNNLALLKIQGLNNPNIYILITSYTIQDSTKPQIVSCLNGKNFYYNFGHSPTSISISGIIHATNEKKVSDFYYTNAATPTSVTLAITNGFTGKVYITNYTRTVSANSSCMYNFTMNLVFVDRVP